MYTKMGKALKRAALGMLTAAGVLLLCWIPVRTAHAAEAQQVGNLVFFLRYHSDSRDVYNMSFDYTTYQIYNWEKIKEMYDTGNGYFYDNSFKNYISVITEGKINVTNVFPQELPAGDASPKGGVAVYTLQKDYYATDSEMICEVIAAVNSGQIPLPQEKLDYMTPGIVDNVTFIIQGDTIPGGKQEAHKSDFGGSELLLGMRIVHYNVIPSDYLVSADGGIHVKAEQGVIAHEFLHSLGLPDLYRRSGVGVPVGIWDVMASNGSSLQYPLSYLRARQGWVAMDEITQSGTYSLTAVSAQGGSKVFLLKTPLSDSEYICLEYRKKGEPGGYFERILPDSGLVMYRVDTKLTDWTNAAGENYIYVYRPDVTDPENATDEYWGGNSYVNNVNRAALKPGETYGSTDLSKSWSERTLYYSDGSNSGIAVSDLSFSQDGNQLTLRIEFADYANGAIWNGIGAGLGNDVYEEPDLLVDQESGEIYTAVADGRMYLSVTQVRRWDGAEWLQLGEAISGETCPKLALCDGELYLSTRSYDGSRLFCRRYDGQQWVNVAEYSAAYVQSCQLVTDGSNIYLAYQSECQGGYSLTIMDVKKNTKIAESRAVSNMGNPAVCKLGTRFYVAYSDFFGGGEAVVEAYDTSDKAWTVLHGLGITGTNCHFIQENNGKLYVFAGCSGKNPVVAVYDGVQWEDSTVTQMNQYYNVSMNLMGDEVYLTYGDAANSKGCMLRKDGTGYTLIDDRVGLGMLYMGVRTFENTAYTVQKTSNSQCVYVKEKEFDLPQYMLTLTPPSGYDRVELYLDGVQYSVTISGDGSYSTLTGNSNMRTAVMYRYNESGIPVGMYCWRLDFSDGGYSVQALPGLEDLLSYHGFSIRVQSPAGIRFKSGIALDTKSALLGGGVDGFRLEEYGTFYMTAANRSKYSFNLLGRKTAPRGRAYFTEDGVVNDSVFETVSGRARFTSVLKGLPKAQYNTDIAFRAYIILNNGSEKMILYGPPVSRSIYTIARQIDAKGEFAAGSSGYDYVKGIISAVEQ